VSLKKLPPLLVALSCIITAETLIAQSTLFNIPTTDTVAEGKTYLEFDFLPQIPKPDGADRIYIYNPRVVLGLGANLEAGANFEVHSPFSASVFIQPNIKWRFFNNDPKGLASATGVILYVPVNHREEVPTFGLLYGVFSKKVKTGNYGPRFHAGAYGIVHSSDNRV